MSSIEGEINQLAFSLSVSTAFVQECMTAWGSRVALECLRITQDEIKVEEFPTQKFRQVVRKHAKRLKRKYASIEQSERMAREHEEMVREWEESRANGYEPADFWARLDPFYEAWSQGKTLGEYARLSSEAAVALEKASVSRGLGLTFDMDKILATLEQRHSTGRISQEEYEIRMAKLASVYREE